MALFYCPSARGKNDTRNRGYPSSSIVMVTVIASLIHPPGMKCYSTSFYFMPHCPLSHESSEIFHLRDESISPPPCVFSSLFSHSVTNKVMQFSSRRIITWRVIAWENPYTKDNNAYDLLMKNVFIKYETPMVNIVKILIVSIRINYIVLSSDNIDAIFEKRSTFLHSKVNTTYC